jgi:hypothetical protein
MNVNREAFEYQMRQALPAPCRELLEAASEMYGKLGPADVSPLARKHYGTFERMRSALIAMSREGYVAEEWNYRGNQKGPLT